jgi:protein-disulfide isomerase
MAMLNRLKTAIDVGGAVALIVIAVVIGWGAIHKVPEPIVDPPIKKPEPVPSELVSLNDAFSMGKATAPVTILEFGDMECPACSKFANGTFKSIVSTYVSTGRVRFMFKQFPLTQHQMARPAAVAAQCAGQQDQFWGFYEGVYTPDSQLSDEFFASIALRLKLDIPRWNKCQEDSAVAAIVQSQFNEAAHLKLRATPSFLVGKTERAQLRATTAIYGARDLRTFEDAVAAVERSTAANR